MPHIQYQFPINASAEKVFEAISSPSGLDSWWCLETKGICGLNEHYELFFGEPYHWKATVSKMVPNKEFEFTMLESDKDWNGSRVGFFLFENENSTTVQFYHEGWPETNEHFQISSFCWAMYLRLLKRFVEFGEIVSYERRLDA